MAVQQKDDRTSVIEPIQENVHPQETLTEREQCGIIVRSDGLVCCYFQKAGRQRYRPFLRLGPHEQLWVLDPATGQEHHVGQATLHPDKQTIELTLRAIIEK
jgi:hypothetical protein